MNKEEEIAMLEKRLKELRARGAVREKVGFKEGLKRSFKIFGNSAGTVFKSLGEANKNILGSEKQEGMAQKKGERIDIDAVIRGLPA